MTQPDPRTGTGQTTARTRTTVAETDRALVRVAVWWAAVFSGVLAAARRAALWVRQTVQPPGGLLVVAATVGLATGILFGWVEWITAGVIAALLVLLAVPFLFGARSYRVDLTVARERIVAGSGLDGQIVVRNAGRRTTLPGRVDLSVGPGMVEFGVPTLRPGQDVTRPLGLPRMRRGVIDIGPATTVRSDPLALMRREHSFEQVHRLFVHPQTTEIPSTSAGLIRDLEGNATRQLVDSDMSFHAIREYAPGDSQRQIHWKSTAKTGQLMVRQYEMTRRSRMAVVLAIAENESSDDDEFELAVSCAASLALRAVWDSRDVTVVTGSPVPRVVRGRLRSVTHLPVSAPRVMLDAFSAVARLENAMGVLDVCNIVSEQTDRLSVAILVLGSPVPLADIRRAALSFPSNTAVIAVVCDERAAPGVQAISGLTVATVATLEDLAGLLARGADR